MMNQLTRRSLRCIPTRHSRALFSSSSSSKAPTSTTSSIVDEDLTEWIAPNRPLAGDKGQTHLYEKKPSTLSASTPSATTTTTTVSAPDWQQNRKALSMDVPDRNRKFAGAELEVLEGVLLSQIEITDCLVNMGAVNLKSVFDVNRRMGGAEGLVFVTATSAQHLQLLSDTLVRQLKVRKLALKGVMGAKLGAEGDGGDWKVVDCHNYVVHIMLAETRRHLNLEALWSGKDKLLTVMSHDEDEVDDYVAKNPVPGKFGLFVDTNISKKVSQLQRWNMGHKAVVQKPRRKQGSRGGTSSTQRLL